MNKTQLRQCVTGIDDAVAFLAKFNPSFMGKEEALWNIFSGFVVHMKADKKINAMCTAGFYLTRDEDEFQVWVDAEFWSRSVK